MKKNISLSVKNGPLDITWAKSSKPYQRILNERKK